MAVVYYRRSTSGGSSTISRRNRRLSSFLATSVQRCRRPCRGSSRPAHRRGPSCSVTAPTGGITTGPNALTTWTSFAPGGIAGISGANVLVSGARGIPVGAVWDSSDLVGGAGRLTLLMDSDWIFGGLGRDNPERLAVIEN